MANAARAEFHVHLAAQQAAALRNLLGALFIIFDILFTHRLSTQMNCHIGKSAQLKSAAAAARLWQQTAGR